MKGFILIYKENLLLFKPRESKPDPFLFFLNGWMMLRIEDVVPDKEAERRAVPLLPLLYQLSDIFIANRIKGTFDNKGILIHGEKYPP